ncbi:hypothetical protein, partial [Saccharothrix sp. Mg75]|uniref:hypothetical protein n=1 Tax=Saccharothrix sp. Mg75 TaxID=3445357 RepID=UPI003EED692C
MTWPVSVTVRPWSTVEALTDAVTRVGTSGSADAGAASAPARRRQCGGGVCVTDCTAPVNPLWHKPRG